MVHEHAFIQKSGLSLLGLAFCSFFFFSLNAYSASIVLNKPLLNQVIQRDANDGAYVEIAGSIWGGADSVEARVFQHSREDLEIVPWTKIADSNTISWWGNFTGTLRVRSGGWYSISVRTWKNSIPGKEVLLNKVGVGEVFVAAGQSNSTNYGTVRQFPHDDRIVAFDGTHWNFAADPQPLATTDGSKNGSPWPPMADALFEKLHVPIGILSVGWGGTSIKEWQPDGSLYPRLKKVLSTLGVHGVRAVLWHQGEADARAGLSTEDYKNLLIHLMVTSREDAGYPLHWFVAEASYITEASQSAMDAIRDAQRLVVDNRLTFSGALTDDMHENFRAPDHVHMSDAGLKEHGHRWSVEILKHIPSQFFR